MTGKPLSAYVAEAEGNAPTENKQRAERAYRAVLAYREEGTDIEEAAIDLMTDILHMLPAYGDPEEAHRMAWHHYVAEATPA